MLFNSLLLLFVAAGLAATHGMLAAGAARAAGLPVTRLRVFLGPTVTRWNLFRIPTELGLLPLGSFVEFPSADDDSGDTALDRAPRRTQLAVALLPWSLPALLALLLLGPAEGLAAMALGGWQYVVGGLIFWETGADLARQGAQALVELPPVRLVGLALAKVVALNLMPFGGTSGGRALRAVFGACPRLLVVAALLPGLLAFGWLAALVIAAVRAEW